MITFLVLFFCFAFKVKNHKWQTQTSDGISHNQTFNLFSFFWKFRRETITINGKIDKDFWGFKFHFLEKEFFWRSWDNLPQKKGLGVFEMFLFFGVLCSQVSFLENIFDLLFFVILIWFFGFRIKRTYTTYLCGSPTERIFSLESYFWSIDFTKNYCKTKVHTSINFYYVYTFDNWGREFKSVTLYESPKQATK